MKSTYKVTYHRGLGNPIVLDANDSAEAAKMALAEYRRTTGFVETVSELTIDQVVKAVDLINI